MTTMIGVTRFRSNIKDYLDKANETPIAINRRSRVYIVMTKEHYVDLINKIKMPHVVEMPQGVQTIVHFTTIQQTTT
jgi:prevent-host-death family protein